MTQPPAYAVANDFAPAPPRAFLMDRHYLLYAAKGAMRLQADGQAWTLPPARAALISAGREIEITLPQTLSANSVLFHPSFVPKPSSNLAVFDMSPLARELILACRPFGPDAKLDDYAVQLFQMLAATTWKLAQRPATAGLPVGRSPSVKAALEMMDNTLAEAPSFEEVAAQVAVSPRTLARRFATELEMNWRQALRRLRMHRAIELLAEPNRQVTDVALTVGYQSLSAFNAAFREFAGQTPSDFRSSFHE